MIGSASCIAGSCVNLHSAGDALVRLQQEYGALAVVCTGFFASADYVGGISPALAEKQCPRFNFVPVKTHLTPMKVSLYVNGKFLFSSVK